MKKGFLLIAVLFVVVSCSTNTKAPTNPSKIITNNQLERVDQTIDQFPAPLQQLGLDLPAKNYPGVYTSLKTDQEKFTLVSLAEQVVNKVNDEKVRKEFEPFFIEASKSGFDWTKAVAIRGLGQTGDMGQMHYLIKFLDDGNPNVVDETLVALKFIFDRQNVTTTRAPASNKESVYEIHDANYWKKWAKNN
jgi:hypothetical protein